MKNIHEKPIFEFIVDGKRYKIWAAGKVAISDEVDLPKRDDIIVINRISQLVNAAVLC